MNSSPPTCHNCTKPYTTDNLPRTAKCSHTYCQKCLKSLTQCPIDQALIDNTLPISSYPINMAVAKSITRTQSSTVNNSFTGNISSTLNTSLNGSSSNSAYFSQSQSYQQKPVVSQSQYQLTQPPIHSNPASQFPPYFSSYSSMSVAPSAPISEQTVKPPTLPIQSAPAPAQVPQKATKVHFDIDSYFNTPSYSEPQIQIHPHDLAPVPTPLPMPNPEKQKQRQMCVLHNKQIDLICLDDGIAICSNCALFGDHKLHNIKTIEHSLTECTGVAEKTLNVLSEIKKLQGNIDMKLVEQKIDSACRDKKMKLSGEIKAYYQKILSKVIAAEKESYLELQRMLQGEKSALKEELVNANKEKKRAQWIEEASLLIKQAGSVNSGNKDLEKICKFLDKGNKEDSFLKQGEYILVEMNSFAKLSEQKISGSFSEISITKENIELDKLIKQGCKITKRGEEGGESIWVTPQKGDDDLLLDSLAASRLSRRVHTFSVDTHNQFNQMIFEQFEQRLHTEVSNQKQSFEKDKNKLTDRDRKVTEKEPFGAFNGEAKKKKRIKVPQKYQQAVEDLRNDRVEIIDFTNADLGDSGMIPIFDLLRGTSRVKTLKLIRNKLTDECLTRLLQCCLECKITTINLSQNSLTDYALQILENAEYRELRSITLNQNRINQRNARSKILELKRIGLTLLV